MNSESFKDHHIFDRLNSLKEVLESESAKEKIDFEKLSFFNTVNQYVSQRIKITIPELVQQNELDALSNELNNGIAQINNFLGNINAGHLNNAVNNFNTAINRTRTLPVTLSKSDFNFSRQIANFEKTATAKHKILENQNDELKNRIAEFDKDLNSKEQEIQRLLKLIDSKEQEIQNLNSTFKTEFENIRSSHNQNFQNAQETFRKEFDSEKEKLDKEVEQLKSGIDTDTSDLIKKLQKKLTEAEKLVNTIGNVGVTGNYQLIANKHKDSANFWRWVAIIFMGTFSVLLVWTIIDLSSANFDWTKSLIRLVAAAALSYPATYAARESSKHRKLETLNRNKELELASINPFIEILDDNKKQQIKEKLVEKYFGNDTSTGIENEKEIDNLSVSTIEKLLNVVSKFNK